MTACVYMYMDQVGRKASACGKIVVANIALVETSPSISMIVNALCANGAVLPTWSHVHVHVCACLCWYIHIDIYTCIYHAWFDRRFRGDWLCVWGYSTALPSPWFYHRPTTPLWYIYIVMYMYIILLTTCIPTSHSLVVVWEIVLDWGGAGSGWLARLMC